MCVSMWAGAGEDRGESRGGSITAPRAAPRDERGGDKRHAQRTCFSLLGLALCPVALYTERWIARFVLLDDMLARPSRTRCTAMSGDEGGAWQEYAEDALPSEVTAQSPTSHRTAPAVVTTA